MIRNEINDPHLYIDRVLIYNQETKNKCISINLTHLYITDTNLLLISNGVNENKYPIEQKNQDLKTIIQPKDLINKIESKLFTQQEFETQKIVKPLLCIYQNVIKFQQENEIYQKHKRLLWIGGIILGIVGIILIPILIVRKQGRSINSI